MGKVCQIEGGKKIKNKNSSSINILSIIKVAPGIIILGYAYIYLIGYFYLFSYFEAWGLSTLEIGFSIIDYATVAIYPIFLLIVKSFPLFFLGYFLIHQESIKKIICGKTEKRKTLIYSLMYLVPLFIWVVFLPIWKFSFSDWPDISFTVNIYTYYIGLTLGIHRYSRKSYAKLAFYILLVILLFSLPICSSLIGTSFPKLYRKYSFNPLKFPSEITKVIIYTSNPISELEIFQTESNKYEGLMLLVYKNDMYYFVVDVKQSKKSGAVVDKELKEVDALSKEISALNKEIDDELEKVGSYEASKIQKEISKEIEEVEKLSLSIADKEERMKIIRAKLDKAEKISNREKKILSNAKDKTDKMKKAIQKVYSKLKHVNKLNKFRSNMLNSTFAIRKEQIKSITYLKEEKEKIEKSGSHRP